MSADLWPTAESEEEMDISVAPFDPLTNAGGSSQVKARFRGKDRLAAKTTIASAPQVEKFDSLTDLLDTLPSDHEMLNHDPSIPKSSTSGRVDEENRNVRVTAWIYAVKYEADQDWHVIIGTDPSAGHPVYFNAEVSGLPAKKQGSETPAYATLLGVRTSFAQILGENDLPGPGSYTEYEPFPVIIAGSLFYDVDHAPGVVGPGAMKPKTAWEIHPVTSIKEP